MDIADDTLAVADIDARDAGRGKEMVNRTIRLRGIEHIKPLRLPVLFNLGLPLCTGDKEDGCRSPVGGIP